ncbi:hypothetical protein GCM10009828_101790 [Actinoplanes couchii]|uniref:AB hydrolase-1 domain-containing protein n=1 Tax=Actinoplanes couchii TaxID=403638 RepID=A0ABQ3XLP1_9ACTN|nr:hypothetical protein Aco03nite_078100 [Actinoplanes couchii]
MDVGGVAVRYRVGGDAGGRAVVLLHGLGGSGAGWGTVPERLAGEFRVFALDLRGHGDSGKPGEYSFQLMRDDVLGFLDGAGLERAALVGHSLGAVVAVLLAQLAPERVTHLVLEDATVPRPGDLDRPPLPEPDEPTPYDFRAVNAVRAQLTDPDPAWWDATDAVTVPTLIIDGASSADRQEFLAASADRMPNARLVTIPAGHYVHRERPSAYLDAVLPFLRSTSG